MVFLLLLVQLPNFRQTKNLLGHCSMGRWGGRRARGPGHGPLGSSHKCKFPSRCSITPLLIFLHQSCLLPLPLKVTCFTMRKPHGSPFLSPLISSVVGARTGFCLMHCHAGRPANVLAASLSGRSDLSFRWFITWPMFQLDEKVPCADEEGLSVLSPLAKF